MIDWFTLKKLADLAVKIKEEMPWTYDNFFYQSDPYHVNLVKGIYDYIIENISQHKFESGRHEFKNIYVIGSWYSLELYYYLNERRKDHITTDRINFTFIDRNKDYIKILDMLKEIEEDTNITNINADVVFDKIDFSKADLVIIPYAEEIMPIHRLDLNIKCPIVAAFTYHRFQRERNRNFSEPLDIIDDIHVAHTERFYLRKLGDVDDWIYADLLTIDLNKD